LVGILAITSVQSGNAEQLSTYEILNQGIEFGDWSKTRSLCDQILQEHPGDPDALVAWARLRSLVGKTHEDIRDCDWVLAKPPRFAWALSTRGTILCNIGKANKGQADLKLYLELTKSDRDSDTKLRRAFAFEYLKNDKESIKVCQDIV